MRILDSNSKRYRTLAMVTLHCFVLQIILPLFQSNSLMAQTGPGQAESMGASVNGSPEMVDKFTGDFTYTVPIMDVEGYPIILSYNQNVAMETEASWVGLGWSLNLGSVSRNMRGLPDDFNGSDKVERTYKLQENRTFNGKKNGLVASGGLLWGGGGSPTMGVGAGISALWGNYENSYNGYGKTKDFGLAGSFSVGDAINGGLNLGIGYNFDTQNGAGRSTSVGLSGGLKGKGGMNGGLNASWTGNFNSRSGRNAFTIGLGANLGYSKGAYEQYGGGASVSVGGVHSLGSLTSVPRLQFPYATVSEATQNEIGTFYKNLATNWGVEAAYVNVQYETSTSPKVRTINQSAFGYMHYGKRKSVDKQGDFPIMDYNFTHISELSENSKKLPFSAPTYDMYTFSVAGAEGQFRAQRGDIGTLRDATIVSDASGESNTFRFGGGAVSIGGPTAVAFKLGYTRGEQDGEQQSGEWMYSGHEDFEYVSGAKNSFDAPVYIKSVGEMTPFNDATLNSLGGLAAVQRVPSDLGSGNVSLTNQVVNKNGTLINTVANIPQQTQGRKPIRATNYNLRTAEERSNSNANIEYRQMNTPYYSNASYSNRITSNKKKHHVSSPEIVAPTGMKYVYDIPVYNISHESVQFSASGLKSSLYDSEGLTYYTAGVDNSVNNARGKVQMFDRTKTPAYAHSYLLTEVYSPDYVDVDQNGPTPNDQGNYYKFNYSQVYGESDPYTWRKPFSGKQGQNQPKAYFNDNFQATIQDDMGSYTYGEKEVYLVHSLESKNMVAEFIISPRKDAYAQDENGFIDELKPGYKLDKIVLYNKNERKNNPNAVPLQVVEFEYDYSLCPEFPLNINNYNGSSENTGKLTLKAIRFKNKNSEEVSLAPYLFNYGTENESYSTLNVDRWGNFKNNDANYPNSEFPYVNQVEATANYAAANWKLKSIRTPENGYVNVSYEADRYEYVQNKKVMNHYRLLGMTTPMRLSLLMNQVLSVPPTELSSTLRTVSSEYDDLFDDVDAATSGLTDKQINARIFGETGNKSGGDLFKELANNVLVFEFDEPYTVTSTATKDDLESRFVNEYLRQENGEILDEVYCKTRIQVDANEAKYETIPTFAPVSSQIPVKYNDFLEDLGLERIQSYGLLGSDNGNGSQYKYGYIVLDLDGVKDFVTDKNGNPKNVASSYYVNPIQKSAWQFSKRHLPEVVYADCNGNNCDYKTNIDRAVVFGGDVNKELNDLSFCLNFTPEKSSVRLYKQSGVKYSTNARVASLTFGDNWEAMTDAAGASTAEDKSEFTWKYSYDTQNKSYGVSAYEPQVGNDVNPFYQWTRYTNIVKSYPDESMFTQEPFAEILFPSPVIGYSQVKVAFDNPNQFNNTGEIVSYFNTAYEYPTFSDNTYVKKEVSRKIGLLRTVKAVALSQGYVVRTNDFHGKIKRDEVYDALGNAQSIVKYNYKNLGDKIKMLDRSAAVSNELVGTEVDVYAESRFNRKKSTSFSVGGDVYVGWVIPNPIPAYFEVSPDLAYVNTESGFYTNTFNKIINQSAILESVETEYLGSLNTNANIAYDKYSGSVLVSSVTDEYNDPLYSMAYPAHWVHDHFRNYHRESNTLSGVNMSGSTFNDVNEVFTEGDIVSVISGGNSYDAQVLERNGSTCILINPDGSTFNQVSGSCDIVLVQTLRKNALEILMQSVTTKDGDFLGQSVYNPKDNIISNEVAVYSEAGATRCYDVPEKPQLSLQAGDVVNPFVLGLKGVHRISEGYAYQTTRTNFVNNLGTRYDGVLVDYKPFYDLSTNPQGGWARIDEQGHPLYPSGNPTNFDYLQGYRKLGDVVKIDEFGKPVQVNDQINVDHAVLYGYNSKLKLVPVAQASNAEQNEIAFDGFEDYTYQSNYLGALGESHFDFNVSGVTLTEVERHSGLKSLVLGGSRSISVNKTLAPVLDADDCQVGDGHVYTVKECECVSPFNPGQGKYLLSTWVKVKDKPLASTYSEPRVQVYVDGGLVANLAASGPIIEGWQKLEGTFDIPANPTTMTVTLSNTGSDEVYFDDFRIHPFLADMATTVYHPGTLLPMATHNGYNYTTFYNFDENYLLVGAKVETIEGVHSISSSERSTVKSYKGQ